MCCSWWHWSNCALFLRTQSLQLNHLKVTCQEKQHISYLTHQNSYMEVVLSLDSEKEKLTMCYTISGWTNLVIDHANWSRMELLEFWMMVSSWSLRSSLAGGLMVHREVDSPGKRTWRKSCLWNCWPKSGKAWTIALTERVESDYAGSEMNTHMISAMNMS